jgi:hypothetical protein
MASPTSAPKGDDDTAYVVTVSVSQKALRTFGTGSNECTDVEATVKNGAKVAAGVEIYFSVIGKSDQKDKGAVAPDKVETDARGVAKAKFCAGRDEGKVFLTAQAGVSTANTADIEATSIPSYRFSWKDPKAKAFAQRVRDVRSQPEKLSDLLASGTLDGEAAAPISLSLRGGGNDCALVEFEITRDGIPSAGEVVRFQTQEDVPVGVKLAKREGVGATAVNAVTGKKYAYYNGTANADGVYQVPVCAGTLPGNIILSATFTESDGRTHDARSPLIVMNGGVTNYGYLSLSFDSANARVIPADTFTNTQKTLPYIARLGTLNDGSIIRSYPLSLIAEVGKMIVEDNGFPNGKGEVKFTYESLNLRGGRPFRAHPTLPDIRENDTTGPVACDPLQFQALPGSGVGTPFWLLAENWRSTFVYYIRGSEYFRVNGSSDVFDPSKAFGFWDVNQNGTYDGNGNNDASTDKITAVPAGRTAASFNQSADSWFIDLPSPFVDGNENEKYDVGEQLVGDEYVGPNGKYDDNSYVWKSAVVPLYLGATEYSLQHSQISSTVSGANAFRPSEDWATYHEWLHTTFSGTNYTSRIALGGRESQLFGRFGNEMAVTNINERRQWYYIHAQDKCGNPIPGGTKINLNYVVESPAAWGQRAVRTNFYVQPYDSLREASKRLLAKAEGSEAVVNSDVIEHPAAKASYPLEFLVRVAPCENRCSGDLHTNVANNPPLYCAAEQGYIALTVENAITIHHRMSMDAVYELGAGLGTVTSDNPCGCAGGASLKGSNCQCPSGQAVNDLGTACEVAPP